MKGDVSPLLPAGTQLFTAYDDDYLSINQQPYHSGLSIHRGQITHPWGPEKLRSLNMEHLTVFLEQPPEVLILGTGRTTCFPEADILDFMAEKHIGFECMDSRSAARTYNILVAEGRTVSAAMLLPSARR